MPSTMTNAMKPTQREYFLDTMKFSSQAQVQEIISPSEDKDSYIVILNRTIFHPQGGGQPADIGTIIGEESGVEYVVEDVQNDAERAGVIRHIGHFRNAEESFTVGERVRISVNEDKRLLHARLHSAGHLIDVAMQKVCKDLVPTKGCHFPGISYVEYDGVIDAAERESAREAVQQEIERLIAEDVPVTVTFEEEADEDRMLSKKRHVRFGDHEGCCCGGTHVVSARTLGKVLITKLQKKKQTTRVKYTVDGA